MFKIWADFFSQDLKNVSIELSFGIYFMYSVLPASVCVIPKTSWILWKDIWWNCLDWWLLAELSRFETRQWNMWVRVPGPIPVERKSMVSESHATFVISWTTQVSNGDSAQAKWAADASTRFSSGSVGSREEGSLAGNFGKLRESYHHCIPSKEMVLSKIYTVDQVASGQQFHKIGQVFDSLIAQVCLFSNL